MKLIKVNSCILYNIRIVILYDLLVLLTKNSVIQHHNELIIY
jgi:hypothetical protein